jgi:hypothetical protein
MTWSRVREVDDVSVRHTRLDLSSLPPHPGGQMSLPKRRIASRAPLTVCADWFGPNRYITLKASIQDLEQFDSARSYGES